jgi:hypothetical protein
MIQNGKCGEGNWVLALIEKNIIDKYIWIANLNSNFKSEVATKVVKHLKLFKKSYLKYRIIKIGRSRAEFDKKVQLIYNNGNNLNAMFVKSPPILGNNINKNYNYVLLDSNNNNNNISIRCCNELPIDYYFVNNQLSEYKVDDSVLKSTFFKYNKYIDSLQIQQQKRRQIIKQKR